MDTEMVHSQQPPTLTLGNATVTLCGDQFSLGGSPVLPYTVPANTTEDFVISVLEDLKCGTS